MGSFDSHGIPGRFILAWLCFCFQKMLPRKTPPLLEVLLKIVGNLKWTPPKWLTTWIISNDSDSNPQFDTLYTFSYIFFVPPSFPEGVFPPNGLLPLFFGVTSTYIPIIGTIMASSLEPLQKQRNQGKRKFGTWPVALKWFLGLTPETEQRTTIKKGCHLLISAPSCEDVMRC